MGWAARSRERDARQCSQEARQGLEWLLELHTRIPLHLGHVCSPLLAGEPCFILVQLAKIVPNLEVFLRSTASWYHFHVVAGYRSPIKPSGGRFTRVRKPASGPTLSEIHEVDAAEPDSGQS